MSIPTIADKDPWLEPYRGKLEEQQEYIRQAKQRLLGDTSLEDFALGHLYFGLHSSDKGWVLREWAPSATAVYLHCDKSNWQDENSFVFIRGENNVWELRLPVGALSHGDPYKLNLHW